MSEGEDAKRDLSWKILLWAIAGFISINSAMLTYFGSMIYDLSGRIVAIESSRFTARDGLSLRNDLSALEQRVAAFPKEIPPSWFKQDVEDIESRVRAIEKQLWQREPDIRKRP